MKPLPLPLPLTGAASTPLPTLQPQAKSQKLRDAAVTVALLAAGVLWETSGADQALTRLFGQAGGFAWRNHFITATLVHEGGRMLAWATLLALLVCALHAPVPVPVPVGPAATRTPSRGERRFWLAITLLCLLLVPALKRYSATSCPWDLAEYGGAAQAVSHWLWGVADGGPGHCFPSGHAVGALAFLSQYFLWRPHQPRRARRWLWLVLATGCVFGLGQLARGAHHASHSFWSGWLCWTVCVVAHAWRPAPGR